VYETVTRNVTKVANCAREAKPLKKQVAKATSVTMHQHLAVLISINQTDSKLKKRFKEIRSVSAKAQKINSSFQKEHTEK
jgi:hypothetical protein